MAEGGVGNQLRLISDMVLWTALLVQRATELDSFDIPKGQENELVALIPYNDKRLKPRRT